MENTVAEAGFAEILCNSSLNQNFKQYLIQRILICWAVTNGFLILHIHLVNWFEEKGKISETSENF